MTVPCDLSTQVPWSDEDDWVYPYSTTEVIWGILLAGGIFGVNLWVMWVVLSAKELWKPRHLWMACLCFTDLFVGLHKVIELLLLVLPMKDLCIVNKATFGIPYILNILVLTLLSLDRYVAVAYPFVYTAVSSNKHVGIGFVLVLLTGLVLTWSSIAIGLQDVVCRVHFLQLKYLIVTLTLCSVLTLFFNVSVLRIAKKQLTAIYTTPQAGRPLAVVAVCSNCGETTAVNEAIVPIPVVVPVELMATTVSPFRCPTPALFEIEGLAPELGARTASLPELIPLSVDEAFGSKTTFEENPGTTAGSLVEVNLQADPGPRRCRSLFSFSAIYRVPNGRVQFLRHLHFSRSHMFHVGRLFPSIRFARTVLLIMIPMWIFIFPVITIIPLHRSCELGTTRIGCSTVDNLWTYLLVHIRSVLLLQAILDTLIYACRSKEFRSVVKRADRKGSWSIPTWRVALGYALLTHVGATAYFYFCVIFWCEKVRDAIFLIFFIATSGMIMSVHVLILTKFDEILVYANALVKFNDHLAKLFRKERVNRDGMEWPLRSFLVIPFISFFLTFPAYLALMRMNWDVTWLPKLISSYVPAGNILGGINAGVVTSIDWFIVLLFASQILTNANAICCWFRFQNNWLRCSSSSSPSLNLMPVVYRSHQVFHGAVNYIVFYVLPTALLTACVIMITCTFCLFRFGFTLSPMLIGVITMIGFTTIVVCANILPMASRITVLSSKFKSELDAVSGSHRKFLKSCAILHWRLGGSYELKANSFIIILHETVIAVVIDLLLSFD